MLTRQYNVHVGLKAVHDGLKGFNLGLKPIQYRLRLFFDHSHLGLNIFAQVVRFGLGLVQSVRPTKKDDDVDQHQRVKDQRSRQTVVIIFFVIMPHDAATRSIVKFFCFGGRLRRTVVSCLTPS
jgi:hypothetical protein